MQAYVYTVTHHTECLQNTYMRMLTVGTYKLSRKLWRLLHIAHTSAIVPVTFLWTCGNYSNRTSVPFSYI